MAWLGEELPKDRQDGATPFAPRTNKDLIEEALFARRRDLFSDLAIVFFDTTSIYFEGEGGETIGQRGHSKDHRPDLKQMVVGMVLDQKGNPLCTELWPGNTARRRLAPCDALMLHLSPVRRKWRESVSLGRFQTCNSLKMDNFRHHGGEDELRKVLEWRQTQLEMEEIKFKREAAALAEIDRRRAECEPSGIKAEVQVRAWVPVTGRDLEALSSFRLRVKARKAEMAIERAAQVKKLEAQEAAMLEARRRSRLLERLQERRAGEWRTGENRALETTASETYLAQWNRRQPRGPHYNGGL
jgi:hypothetical protein